MKELGKFLKKQRTDQKASLEDMASRTKIHIQRLIDIEEGRRDQLPEANVFCIGLIKSYARELRADMDKVNQLVDQAFNEPKKDLEIEKPTPTPSPAPNRQNSDDNKQMVGLFKVPKSVIVAASAVLSVVLILVIFQVVEKMNSYSQEEALPEEVFVTEDDTSEESAETEEVAANQEEVNPAGAKETKPVEKAAEKTEAKAPAPEPPTEPQPEPEIAAEEPTQVTQAKVKPIDMSEGDFSEDNFSDSESKPEVVSDNKLTLTALEPVRAEVVWSDGYVQVMLLKSNETKTLVFSQPITLRVNNGGAIQVSFNEAEKSVPGTFNKPIEIQYP